MSAKSGLRTFAPKVTPVTYERQNAPKFVTNFFESLKANSSVAYKTANTYQVNVLPDFTPLLCSIMREADDLRSQITKVGNPKCSTYTYIAYCLNLVYTFFAIHDAHINPDRSYYTDELQAKQSFEKFIDIVQDFPVPESVSTFLKGFAPFCLETQSNIWFCPSANSFSHHMHFGRIYPVNLFFAIHDLVSAADARTTPGRAFYDLASTEIYTIEALASHPLAFPIHPATTAVPSAEATYLFGNYFAHYYQRNHAGSTSTVTNQKFLSSKLNQVLDTVFSPNSVRKYVTEQPSARIGLNPIVVPVSTYNPYDVMMSLGLTTGNSNVNELTTVYRSVATVLNEIKSCTGNLASLLSGSGNEIVRHGYSSYPLPHFDAHSAINDADPTGFSDLNATFSTPANVFDYEHAATLRFKESVASTGSQQNMVIRSNHIGIVNGQIRINPALPSSSTSIISATVSFTALNNYLTRAPVSTAQMQIDDTNRHEMRIDPALDPVPTAADFTSPTISTGPFKAYSSDDDELPLVKYVDVAASTVSIHLAGFRGLIIYSDEIAASIVPHVNSGPRCHDDNNQFLQSALPMSICHPAVWFKSNLPIGTRVTSRPTITAAEQPALVMIRSPNVVYDNTVSRYSFDYGYQRQNYGLTNVTDQDAPIFNQTVIGHNVPTVAPRRRNAPASEPPNTPYGHVLCWSPYAITEPSLVRSSSTDYSRSLLQRTRFLVNLRTIFGTQVQVYEAESPIHAIPI